MHFRKEEEDTFYQLQPHNTPLPPPHTSRNTQARKEVPLAWAKLTPKFAPFSDQAMEQCESGKNSQHGPAMTKHKLYDSNFAYNQSTFLLFAKRISCVVWHCCQIQNGYQKKYCPFA